MYLLQFLIIFPENIFDHNIMFLTLQNLVRNAESIFRSFSNKYQFFILPDTEFFKAVIITYLVQNL